MGSSLTVQEQINREIARYGGLSPTTQLPTIPLPIATVDSLLATARAVKIVLDAMAGDGVAADRILRVGDLLAPGETTINLPDYTGAGGGSGGGGGGGGLGYVDSRPILSTPPTLTNLTVLGTLKAILVEWDRVDYQNHSFVEVWRATSNSLGSAVLHGTTVADQYIDQTAAAGVTYYYWVRAVGMLPADGSRIDGAFNAVSGVSGGIGKVGNVDLGALIVEAGNLASDAVTASKIALGAVDLTKFASGIEPVTIVTGAFPATKLTETIFWTDKKLYRWDGTAYVASVLAGDISGTLADAQIASIDAAKITGALTDSQIADISAAKVTGQIVSTQITDGAISTPKLAAGSVTTATLAAGAITTAKLAAGAVTATEIAAGAITTAKLAAGAVTAGTIAAGTITTTQLAAGGVNADRLVANSITSGQIAAGAVTATQLAAGAVTAGKLLVTGLGMALNADPQCMDASAWTFDGRGRVVTLTDGIAGRYALELDGTGGTYGYARTAREFEVAAGKQYRVRLWARRSSGTGVSYFRLPVMDATGAVVAYAVAALEPSGGGNFESLTIPGTWTRYSGTLTAPASSAYAYLECITTHPTGGGIVHVQDVRVEEYLGADLIVDGAITATKLAANSIAVGTAAVQNGAIVNAMIGTAAIDTAKIADASIVNAKLADASITTAKIADASITNAKIVNLDASKISTGTLNAGLVFAGTLSAATGTFSGALTGATGTFSGALVAATGTFSGALVAATGTFDGSLIAAGGTFAGALLGATGTFTGTLTAGSAPLVVGTSMTGSGAVFNPAGTFAIGNSSKNISFNGTDFTINGDVVVTGNIKNNAITVSNGVELSSLESVNASDGEVTLVTFLIANEGKPLYIHPFARVHFVTSTGGGSVTMRVRIAGAEVATRVFGAQDFDWSEPVYSPAPGAPGTSVGVALSIQVTGGGWSVQVAAGDATMFALALKR